MGVARHRTVIGRTREVRGPDALEGGFAGIVIAVATAIAGWYGIQLMQMSQALDAVTVVRAAQINAIVYHAVHGRWPSPRNLHIVPADSRGKYVKQLVLGEGGSFSAELRLDTRPVILAGLGLREWRSTHGFLSFRPELLGSKDAPSVSFLCGYAKPVAGALNTGVENRTTLPRNSLPPFCR